MHFKILALASVWALGGLGCASSPVVSRSPGFMEQPVGEVVMGQCHVEGDVHTIRHAIRLERAGQLAITAAVNEGALNAEILLRDPSGMYVQQLITSPSKAHYAMTVPVDRGTWEVVVVCRRGTARYTMQARYRAPLAIGAAR